MKRRIAVFAIVWAYAVNALWVPGGLDWGYFLSIFLPASYYFLIGAMTGIFHELLASRWPRIWVSLALGAILTEWVLYMFSGNLVGLRLALLFAIGTGLASYSTTITKFTKFQIFKMFNSRSFSILIIILLSIISISPYQFGKNPDIIESPDKIYISCNYMYFIDEESYRTYVGPRKSPLMWFGTRLDGGTWASPDLKWTSKNTLEGSSDIDLYERFCDVRIEIHKNK